MLGKLFKYDIKSIIKGLIVFYSLAIFFALLTRGFLNIENSLVMDIIGRVCSGVTISMIFNILVNIIMRCWVKFKNNLYGDESYLTHTLPVTKAKIYYSKIITALITLFLSVAVITVTLIVAYYSKENIEMLKNVLLPVANILDSSATFLIVMVLLVLFLEIANILQCGFTGIILGHRFNSAKAGLSVLIGFIVYMASQAIVVICVFAAALFNKDFMNLFVTNSAVDISVIKSAVYISIIAYICVLIIGCIVNVKLLKKGVNVD